MLPVFASIKGTWVSFTDVVVVVCGLFFSVAWVYGFSLVPLWFWALVFGLSLRLIRYETHLNFCELASNWSIFSCSRISLYSVPTNLLFPEYSQTETFSSFALFPERSNYWYCCAYFLFVCNFILTPVDSRFYAKEFRSR